MELFSLVSFLAVLVVGTTVGARLLLLARRTRKLPELSIGTACFTMAVGGILLIPTIYLADTWPERLIFASTITARCLWALGASAVCVVTWQIFRPGRLWAASATATASLVLVVALLVQGFRGDAMSHWALVPENQVYMWVRIAAFLWVGLESLRYAGMMQRQASVGLGDPVAAAQIRLWGVAIAAMLAFWALAPHLGHTSLRGWPAGMFMANTLGLLAAGSIHPALMPPAGWRRWIEKRAACGQAS